MIELDLVLPLSRFRLEVAATLPADTVAVLGPSGSGKTSLLESIAGLRPKAAGRVVIRGERVMDTAADLRAPARAPADRLRAAGRMPVSRTSTFPATSGSGSASAPTPRIFEEAVEILEIAPLLDRFPATLSGGERQRVALARAIATEPRLLLLDEPLAAVDAALRGRILPYLLRVRQTLGVPFLYVTHNAGEARAVAEAALVLQSGALVFAGTPGGRDRSRCRARIPRRVSTTSWRESSNRRPPRASSARSGSATRASPFPWRRRRGEPASPFSPSRPRTSSSRRVP